MDASSTASLGYWLTRQDWRGSAEQINRPGDAARRDADAPAAGRSHLVCHPRRAKRAKPEMFVSAHLDVVCCVVPVKPPCAKARPLLDGLPVVRKRLTK